MCTRAWPLVRTGGLVGYVLTRLTRCSPAELAGKKQQEQDAAFAQVRESMLGPDPKEYRAAQRRAAAGEDANDAGASSDGDGTPLLTDTADAAGTSTGAGVGTTASGSGMRRRKGKRGAGTTGGGAAGGAGATAAAGSGPAASVGDGVDKDGSKADDDDNGGSDSDDDGGETDEDDKNPTMDEQQLAMQKALLGTNSRRKIAKLLAKAEKRAKSGLGDHVPTHRKVSRNMDCIM